MSLSLEVQEEEPSSGLYCILSNALVFVPWQLLVLTWEPDVQGGVVCVQQLWLIAQAFLSSCIFQTRNLHGTAQPRFNGMAGGRRGCSFYSYLHSIDSLKYLQHYSSGKKDRIFLKLFSQHSTYIDKIYSNLPFFSWAGSSGGYNTIFEKIYFRNKGLKSWIKVSLDSWYFNTVFYFYIFLGFLK